jgi:hypothetical protein
LSICLNGELVENRATGLRQELIKDNTLIPDVGTANYNFMKNNCDSLKFKISLQVLPTEATSTPQSVLMAWRAAVICREKLILNVIREGLAEGNIERNCY